MKMIVAMIQPFMLNKVVAALEVIENFPGMSVSEVRGFGRRQSLQEERSLHLDQFHDKTRIEIAAPDELVESITAAIVQYAHTGNNGDGKVFVWEVVEAIRIQTNERAGAAL